jgi:prepilin-type N-terminal cleavage/methylation domain-containing protein
MARPAGFTLIEIALALFIIALLAGSLFVPLNARVEARQIAEVEMMLAEAKEELLGYAAARGYLPCPDITNDGEEDVAAGGTCLASSGNFPATTLGMNRHFDPWGNRLRYRVEVAFAARLPAARASLTTQANVRVCNTTPCLTADTILTDYDPAAPVPGNEAVVVILSHGMNGYGAVTSAGTTIAAPTGTSEIANTGAGPFVSRTRTALGAAAGEFDDIVTWIGKSSLSKQMIAAEQWP